MEGVTLQSQMALPSTQVVESLRTGELIRTIIGGDEFSSLSFGGQIENKIALDDLSGATLPELQDIDPSISRVQFAILMAAVELGRRVAEAKLKPLPRSPITSSTAAITFCEARFSRLITDAKREELHVITLNTKNRFINTHLVSIGTLDASLVHPREVFRPAIKDAASSLIAVHNHPSGDPTPSKEDLTVTERLEKAGETIGVDFLDHIVVARDGSKSIREFR